MTYIKKIRNLTKKAKENKKVEKYIIASVKENIELRAKNGENTAFYLIELWKPFDKTYVKNYFVKEGFKITIRSEKYSQFREIKVEW